MLNYRRSGRGKPLLLQHGFLGGAGVWTPTMAHFSSMFDVIAPDLPGFAGSRAEKAPDSIEGFAKSLIALVDELGIETFLLVGNSLGATISLQLALDFPSRVSRLVLYGASPSAPTRRFESIETTIERIGREGLATIAPAIAATWFRDGERHVYYRPCLEAGQGASEEAAITTLKAVSRWDVTGRLGEIKVPTLVLCGDADRSTPPEDSYALWRGISNARLCVVPGCAHIVHLEKTDLFHRIVGDFLSEEL